MARFVTQGLVAELATQYGVTEEQVRQFIATHVDNGNIQNVLAYVGNNQGATNARVATELTLDQTTADRILTLLVAANLLEEI